MKEDDLTKLAHRLFVWNIVVHHRLALELNGKCECMKWIHDWDKYKSDWRGVARLYLKGKS